MTQNQLNREIARATGETVDRIRRLGFTLTVIPQQSPWPRAGANRIRRTQRLKSVNVNTHQSKAA